MFLFLFWCILYIEQRRNEWGRGIIGAHTTYGVNRFKGKHTGYFNPIRTVSIPPPNTLNSPPVSFPQQFPLDRSGRLLCLAGWVSDSPRGRGCIILDIYSNSSARAVWDYRALGIVKSQVEAALRRKQRRKRSSQESGWRAELCGHREEATRGSSLQRRKVTVVEESSIHEPRKHLACCCLWGLVCTMPGFVPLFRRASIPIRTLLEHSQLRADVPPHAPNDVTSYIVDQGFCHIFQVQIVRHGETYGLLWDEHGRCAPPSLIPRTNGCARRFPLLGFGPWARCHGLMDF